MVHFLSLPFEILDIIGDLLDNNRTDIYSLILTSRQCHHHFLRRIWRHISLSWSTDPEFAPLLRSNAKLVRSLHFKDHIPRLFHNITFSNLTIFQHDYPERLSNSKGATRFLARFIRRHPTIQDITITTNTLHLGKKFWTAISCTLRKPRLLCLDGIWDGFLTIQGASAKAFWRTCSQFEELRYCGSDQSGSISGQDVECSQIKRLELTFDNNRLMDPNGLWKWIGNCHNLTQLHAGNIVLVPELLALAERAAWPHLDNLSLNAGEGNEEMLAAIFRCLPPLKRLAVKKGSNFSHCSVSLHPRHFATLTTLTILEYLSFPSCRVLQVLANCPLLEELSVNHICWKDLVSNPQPWVCHGLRRLRTSFESESDNPEANIILFKRLSRLTLLETININHKERATYGMGGGYYPLYWRVNAGLGLLTTLTRLKELGFPTQSQNLGIKDVQWMLDHWPALMSLTGRLAVGDQANSQLQALCRQRGVVCSQT